MSARGCGHFAANDTTSSKMREEYFMCSYVQLVLSHSQGSRKAGADPANSLASKKKSDIKSISLKDRD